VRERERTNEGNCSLIALKNDESQTIDMLCASNRFVLQLNKFLADRVAPRKHQIYKVVRDVSKVVNEVLHEVEAQEPRFISSLNETNGRFEGLTVISETEFEVSVDSCLDQVDVAR
jgi:PBP1b-binding outer membrane lipoprotein LpoB